MRSPKLAAITYTRKIIQNLTSDKCCKPQPYHLWWCRGCTDASAPDKISSCCLAFHPCQEQECGREISRQEHLVLDLVIIRPIPHQAELARLAEEKHTKVQSCTPSCTLACSASIRIRTPLAIADLQIS